VFTQAVLHFSKPQVLEKMKKNKKSILAFHVREVQNRIIQGFPKNGAYLRT
jgi:hypothetical protein